MLLYVSSTVGEASTTTSCGGRAVNKKKFFGGTSEVLLGRSAAFPGVLVDPGDLRDPERPGTMSSLGVQADSVIARDPLMPSSGVLVCSNRIDWRATQQQKTSPTD